MLICLICALTGKLVQLQTRRVAFTDGNQELLTWCRKCRHAGCYPS